MDKPEILSAPEKRAVVEIVARRIYEDAHKGMSNIWGWDNEGLDDEHPSARGRYLGYAQSAVSSIEELSLVRRTKAFLEEKYVPGKCSDSTSLQDLLSRLDRQEVANLVGSPKSYADPLLCADEIITYVLKKARAVIGHQSPIENADLDLRSLYLARQAYDRKVYDMSGPTPTEEPEAGGGPLGYAIRAYMSALAGGLQRSARAEAAEARITALELRLAEAERVIEQQTSALLPLSNAVFNDNGDMTISVPIINAEQCVSAYFAGRAARAWKEGK